MELVATGLAFPEGPIAVPGGDVLVAEIQNGNLTRISASGDKTVIAHCGGGPNGAALGPDGCVYVCNNGGFGWTEINGFTFPTGRAERYLGGSIQRVDPKTGEVDTLYEHCGPNALNAPNDIVFDSRGGFYFTDAGCSYQRKSDNGVIYYATSDGSHIEEVAYPMLSPNGIGLSPVGDRLYVAETRTARVWTWPVTAAGVLAKQTMPQFSGGAELCYQSAEFAYLDSLAIDGHGNICVATLVTGGVTQIGPDGSAIAYFPVPQHDPLVTNICFGIDDRGSAYITSSGLGRLYRMEWPNDGGVLAYETLKGG
jgi:gluconolactonase